MRLPLKNSPVFAFGNTRDGVKSEVVQHIAGFCEGKIDPLRNRMGGMKKMVYDNDIIKYLKNLDNINHLFVS